MRRGLVGVALIAVMLLLALISVTAWARGEASATPRPLPGRQAATSTPAPDGWRLTGGIEMKRGDDGTWRIDLDFWLRLEPTHSGTPPVAPTPTDAPATPVVPTNTPTMTPSGTPRSTNTPIWMPSPSSTPIATEEPITPTPEDACVVRSTANVWARTLPVVRGDTAIGVLPADSSVRITGYYVEQVSATVSYIWYRYWFDVDYPEAWSRADFFTERDESSGCRLLPRVTGP